MLAHQASHQGLRPVVGIVQRAHHRRLRVHRHRAGAVKRTFLPLVGILLAISQLGLILIGPVKVGIELGPLAGISVQIAVGTVQELLFRVVAKLAGGDLVAGLQDGGGGKSCTGPAVALVLHRRHQALK